MLGVPESTIHLVIGVVVLLVFLVLAIKLIGIRVIGNTEVGIVEKRWSSKGAIKGVIALDGEAGFQPDVLRGGIHLLPGLIYSVHKVPLVTIPRGQIGYVFARDGASLGRFSEGENSITEAGQTLGKVVNGGDFTDVRKFLEVGGQKGPQRAILREGTYAINLAQFTVVRGTQDSDIYYLEMGNGDEYDAIEKVAQDIQSRDGFAPVVIQGANDQIGIVTVHDGPSLPQHDIIANIVGDDKKDPHYHNNFQDPEAFLSAGGFRGRQLQVLTDGTYFINRLFATVEYIAKTVIDVGYVGVVVSYHGDKGEDVSGDGYAHGELCEKGGRGIWKDALLPGKYPFNTYAGKVITVPTVNVILKWEADWESDHKLDSSLREIDLITKDAFEPELPLSVVINIDYRNAPRVIGRFGSVKTLIEQSLDPLVSSYFKNQGQGRTLIELIQQRGEIQASATTDMKKRFLEYDLNLQEVLIGTPHSHEGDGRIEAILNQLRDRQVAAEQTETYAKQQDAQKALAELNKDKAAADMQTSLTQSELNIRAAENAGKADAIRAEQDAKRMVTVATAEAEKTRIAAQAEAERVELTKTAEANGIARTKFAEALGTKEMQKAFGGAETMVVRDTLVAFATAIKEGKIPMVPETLISMGGNGDGSTASNPILQLFTLMGLEKLGLTGNLGKSKGEDAEPEHPLMRELREQAEKSLGGGATPTAGPPTKTTAVSEEAAKPQEKPTQAKGGPKS